MSDKTAAEYRAEIIGRLRQNGGFAEIWAYHQHPSSAENDRLNVESLICIAYNIGRQDATDAALAAMDRTRTPAA